MKGLTMEKQEKPQDADIALKVMGISKYFGSKIAVKDIEFEAKEGEFVCLLGPSGCGKTTLLRLIAGLEIPDSGKIFQNGKNVTNLPPMQRHYGIVFQSYALFPNLTAKENITYGLYNRRIKKAEIEKRASLLLRLIGLPDVGDLFPSQLSGGQQQRIALARALAMEPKLLLLDEPLSALDSHERVRLRNEIKSLQKKFGITTIMVTHDQEEALTIADKIVVMNHGTIEQIGEGLEIYENPKSKFVGDFIGKSNFVNAISNGDGTYSFDNYTLSMNGYNHAKGEVVELFFRPEDITYSITDDLADKNILLGDVKTIEFVGSYVNCKIVLHNSEVQLLLQITLSNYYHRPIPSGTSKVFIHISENKLRVF